MNISQKVAKAYLRKRAMTPAASSSGRFVDLAILVVGYDSLQAHLEAVGGNSTLSDKGLVFIKRYGDEMQSGIQQLLGPLAERPDAGSIRTSIHLALRVASPTPQGIGYWAKAIRNAMPWIKTRTTIFNDLFTGRVARAARELAAVSEEESPVSTLNRLATIAPVSGLTAPHKWLEAVAAEVGAPVSPTESTLVSTQVAKGLGEDLVRVEAAIAAAKPNTPELADLQAKRTSLLTQIGKVADQSPSPAAVLAVAAQAKPTHQYSTETGKKVGLTPDQEEAMMARGRVVIAAGAGSGKTRVLASKVAYHINEQGIPATSVLATSFTRKASAELIKRCGDYGAVIQGAALEGFGTTHAIAGNILNKRARDYRRPNYLGKKEGWKQTTLFRLAMDQVKMQVQGIPAPPPPKGMWDDLMSGAAKTPVAPTPAQPAQPSQPAPTPANVNYAYLNAIDNTLGYFQWAARTWSGGPGDWAKEQIPFLQDMRSADPQYLSPKQRMWLNKLFEKVKGRSQVTYRVAAAADAPQADVPEPKSKQNRLESYTYHKSPAKQWFNLGRKLTRKDPKGNEQPIPMGEFRRAVSILKGKGITPSQAWAGEGGFPPESDHAAVYAAYEWLKGAHGEPEFAGSGDMDDILIDTVSALIDNPTLRRQIQSQYKVLLVDEAQDLNRVQHVMFGLMAGYLDPTNLKPFPDGKMTADTFSLIGDDKQAIYEFRGADPEEFISKSNLVEDGGDFQTKLLDTNFRSGEAIVQAANNLIAHNKRQVPMTCKANVDRNGLGRIVARPCDDTEAAAEVVAEEIMGLMESAVPGTAKYRNFGVALRSNAEAYQYGVEMLKMGIPFKANVQFFNDANTKALIGWLTIADKGLNGPPDLIEAAIRDAVKAPFSNLGAAFFSAMDEKATGSWAAWLVSGGWQQVYKYGKWADILHHFVQNIEAVSKFSGMPSEIVEQILQLRGVDGSSMQEAMIRSVKEDDDLMAELAAESEKGEVSEEQIVEMAMAPISPLIGLMKGKDNLGAAMNYVRKLKDVNSKLATKDTDEEIDRDAVTIGTMHSWKGLEVDTMYIPMIGSKFPRAGKDGVAPENAELASERRLAYVAITRAEQRAVILNIPHPKFGTTSQFITEACIPSEGSNLPDEEGMNKAASYWTDDRIDAMERRAELFALWGEEMLP